MRPIRTLVSFPEPRSTTNPYITQLGQALDTSEEIELQYFSFKNALLGRYDVFHVHWPEILGSGHSRLKSAARQFLTAAFALRLAVTRTPVIRTVHNIERPTGLTRREEWLLTAFDRLTTLRIRLNDVTPMPQGAPFETIPHGHYRDWFAEHPKASPVNGRVTSFGLIRRYKGLESLVSAFHAMPDSDLSLHIAGKPSTLDLAADLTGLAHGDPRIRFTFQFLPDADLVTTVTSARLVVLPYRFMHNSGATLTALSLDRPVLVPNTEVNRHLAEEVGPGWVLCYDGELTGDTIAKALAEAADPVDAAPEVVGAWGSASARPDLSARSWGSVGKRHAAVYRRALHLRRGPI